jgi:hypothetical protein
VGLWAIFLLTGIIFCTIQKWRVHSTGKIFDFVETQNISTERELDKEEELYQILRQLRKEDSV